MEILFYLPWLQVPVWPPNPDNSDREKDDNNFSHCKRCFLIKIWIIAKNIKDTNDYGHWHCINNHCIARKHYDTAQISTLVCI